MLVIPFNKNPDYVIKTDFYPFLEAREILKSAEWWWEHEARSIKNDKDFTSNYSLDPELNNSLETSFENRLRYGNFSFLFYKDELLLYSGLRVDSENTAWVHRAASNPVLGKDHKGAGTAMLIPYLIKCAYELNCKAFCMSFNENKYKFYKWYKDGHFKNSKLDIPGGGDIINRFEFIGKQTIYGVDQYVCRLDLSRPDIHEFFEVK